MHRIPNPLCVVLADPPARGTNLDASYPNLGLLYLAAYLRQVHGNRVTVQYMGPRHTLRSHIESLPSSPFIYGISLTSKAAPVAYATVRAVRERHPDALIVCGGPHPTAMPEHVLRGCPADLCVVGEGELTLAELVSARLSSNPRSWTEIHGLAWPSDSSVRRSPAREYIRNLDSLPQPAWDLVDLRRYPGMHLKIRPVECSLVTSRGCPYECSFCSNPVWRCSRPRLRYRSPESICDELAALRARGVGEVYLCSDELNFSESWTLALAQDIRQRGLDGIYFQCNLRADKLNTELAHALRRMNLWLAHVGIESANDRVLRGIGKHITFDQIFRALNILHDAGIKAFAFMMLFNVWEENGNLRWETVQEVNTSIEVMKSLFKNKLISYMSWQFCTPMPGSRLYEIATRHGLFADEPEQIWGGFDEHRVALRLPGISEKEMKRAIRRGILWKDWFMLRSGRITARHLWRAMENLRALVR